MIRPRGALRRLFITAHTLIGGYVALEFGQHYANLVHHSGRITSGAGIVVAHQAQNQPLPALGRYISRQGVDVSEAAGFAAQVVSCAGVAHAPFERNVNAGDRQRCEPGLGVRAPEHEFEQPRGRTRRDQILPRQPRPVTQAERRDVDPGPLQKLAADFGAQRGRGFRASVIIDRERVGVARPQLPQHQFGVQVLALFVDDFEHLGERLRFDACDFEKFRFVEWIGDAGYGVIAFDTSPHADAATGQSLFQQLGGEPRRIVDGDVDLEFTRAARDAAEKFHSVAVERWVEADAGLAARDSGGVVDDFEISGLGLNFDRWRFARAGRRGDGERHAVVISRQGADLRAVIELRVVPLPARTEQVAREEAVVAD